MPDELIRLTATEAVALLKKKEISPLDLVDAAADRIAVVEPHVNALPILCLDRARDHAKRLMSQPPGEAHQERGWLGGLPIAIKDLMDVSGVRTTYGSPIFKDNVAQTSNPLVERIERLGGIVIGKSNTPEFGAGGNTFNEVFGRTLNPWNTALTCGGSTGGGAVAVATGEVWLAHGTDHGGSLRRPAAYCSVVGIRCSPGRVTRGTANNLWSPQAVQGPMARNIPDLALFLDTMAGHCPHDPLTFDSPVTAFSQAVARPTAPKRIAFTADFGGKVPVDRETREICARMVRRFEELGCEVEEAHPDIGDAAKVFFTFRLQNFLVDRELLLEKHRDRIKPDLRSNLEEGQKQVASRIAWAERERAALHRRMLQFFENYDLLISPSAATPAFDVNLRYADVIDGMAQSSAGAGQLINAAITLTARPSIAVPCGFDRFGRPVGLQITGKARDEAGVLQAAALFEQLTGLDQQLPIDPRPGVVPG
jgi:amidase